MENKVEIKTQKKANIEKDGREGKQEQYHTSVPLIPSSIWNM